MKSNVKNLNKKSKKLIIQHYKKNKNLNFDGAINEKLYKDSKIKILYILKESWGNDKNYSIINGLNKTICKGYNFGNKTNSIQMFNRLAEWTYGILNDCNKYKEVRKELKKSKRSYQKPLCQVAYINVSKEITSNSTTNNSKLKKILRKNKKLIKKQIELFEPNIIITGGIWGEYGIADEIAGIFKMKHKWLKGGANGATIINVNNKNVGLISMRHPGDTHLNAKSMFDEVIKGWNNIKRKLLKN